MGRLNRINYSLHPSTIPDTDDGNFRLYWELELLKGFFESDRLNKHLERYIQIIDVLGERSQFMKIDGDSEIEKVARKSDWYEMITKPIPSPGKKEDRAKFISRCISTVAHADPERKHEQVVAMCHEAWRRREKSEAEPPSLEQAITKPKPELHIHLNGDLKDIDEESQVNLDYKKEKLELVKALRKRVSGGDE